MKRALHLVSKKKPRLLLKNAGMLCKSITHPSVWAAEIHKRRILCKTPGKALYFVQKALWLVQRALYLMEEYHTRQCVSRWDSQTTNSV